MGGAVLFKIVEDIVDNLANGRKRWAYTRLIAEYLLGWDRVEIEELGSTFLVRSHENSHHVA